MSFLFNLLTGIPGLMGKFFDYLQKRTDADLEKYKVGVGADAQINMALLQGLVEEQKVAAAQRAADRESLWTAWMMPALFIVCFIYLCGIVFDSMPLLGHEIGSWKIARLPGEYAALVVGVLGSVAGLKLTTTLTGAVRKIFVK
jgi:hypothetical protein